MKLLEAQDCTHCFHRFEIDTYGRGCVHNCAYCYAKSYLSIRRYWNEPIPFPIDIAEIRRVFATVFETSKRSKFRNILEKRIPLRIGSMSDAFMWSDKKYGVTLELLKILRFYNYPYIIFTRSDLVADDAYMRELHPKLASIQMSISSLNEPLTRQIEPGAPTPRRRLQALQTLAEHAFWTTVRINPLFPIYPDGYYTDPHFDHSKPVKPFNFFSWEMIEVLAQHRVPSVLVGMVRLYQPSVRFMNQALGEDMRSYFAADVQEERASIHFSAAETSYYYQKIRELCDACGLVSRPATLAMMRRERAFTTISISGVTGPIAVMRLATCRPSRKRVSLCHCTPVGGRTHERPCNHPAGDQYPGPMGTGDRVRAKSDRNPLLSHAHAVGRPAPCHYRDAWQGQKF
jgi:DNA repair photolyase